MLIFAKTIAGRNYELDVDSQDLAGKIKDMISERIGIPFYDQIVVFAGR